MDSQWLCKLKVSRASFVLQMFHELWDGFVDESCRANMPKAEACLYGELGTKLLFQTLLFSFCL